MSNKGQVQPSEPNNVRSWDLIGGVITDATYKSLEVHLKDGRYVDIEPAADYENWYGDSDIPDLTLEITRRA